jgi:hypothetical protein
VPAEKLCNNMERAQFIMPLQPNDYSLMNNSIGELVNWLIGKLGIRLLAYERED